MRLKIAAAFTAPGKRTPDQQEVLKVSDQFLEELEPADLIVIGTPMYN
ncbi:NAD(P)H-dependent oxidoreductase [Phormidesmis priestleyi]